MSNTRRLVTADELERLPEDEYRYELVRGRLVRMSPWRSDRDARVAAVAARHRPQNVERESVSTDVTSIVDRNVFAYAWQSN